MTNTLKCELFLMYSDYMFKEKFISGKKVFYSDLIPELEHYFTTRGITVDEDFEGNRKYLKVDSLIHPSQTHSSNVDFAKVGKSDYPNTDALILTNFEQGLYLRFADCTPVILYDKKANIGAIAHAGWRGTVARIVPKTVKKMLEYSTTNITDIYAVIGPAISQCCYQVGQEVIDGVKSSINNTTGLITEDFYIDLKGINSQQLLEIGVPKENIDICPFCTACRNDLFYSYRKENGTPNRHNAVIKLKKATV